MAMVELGGKQVEIDEDGFIQDPNVWDKAVAGDLAKTEGVEDLTDEHWKVVEFLRELEETEPAVKSAESRKATGY